VEEEYIRRRRVRITFTFDDPCSAGANQLEPAPANRKEKKNPSKKK
jgi:hypothetical protein